jgi:hypothetical protein
MRERFKHNDKEFYLVLVEPEDTPEVWPFVKEGVETAMLHSDSVMKGDDFMPQLLDGSCRLWAFVCDKEIVGHMITQLIRYPRKSFVRVLTMQCSGGEKGMLGMDLWHKFVPIIEEYAAQHGCQHLEAYTRKGMVKSLEKYGWENQFNIVTKPVEQLRLH